MKYYLIQNIYQYCVLNIFKYLVLLCFLIKNVRILQKSLLHSFKVSVKFMLEIRLSTYA